MKTKHLVAITLAFTLILSIVLMMSITTTNNNSDITTTTLGIRAEKQPSWNQTIGGSIDSVAISSDGNYIVAGSLDGNVSFFDSSGSFLWSYKTGDFVASVSISSNGNYIAAGSFDNKVYFFNRSGSLLWNYTTDGGVWSVSISSSGDYVAVGSGDNYVYFFERFGSLLWNCTTDFGVASVSISSNGDYVAAGSWDDKVYFFDGFGIQLWNYTTGDYVETVSISSDGNYIAAGSFDNKVYFFDKSGHLWNHSTGSWVRSVSISSNGNYIAAGNFDGNVSFFDSSGSFLWNYTTGSNVMSVDISFEGNYIAAGTIDKNVYFFNKTGSLLWQYTTGGEVASVSVSADSSYIAAAGQDKKVYFFEFATPPTIDHPDDITYEEGTTGHNIDWNPSDYYPSSYNITRDGVLLVSSSWSGGSITINVDLLFVGTYTYICTVTDTEGYSVSDQVIVTVISPIDTTDPVIDDPDDISYEESSMGHTISWNPSDDNPASYIITRNDIVLFSGPWNGSSITWNVDELSQGTYTYTCTVYDEAGNNASDTVIVTVTEKEEKGFPWIQTGIGVIVGLVAGISVAIIYFKKE